MEASVLAPDEIEEWQMLESWLHCQNGKITKAYIGLHPTQEPFKKQGLQLPYPCGLVPRCRLSRKVSAKHLARSHGYGCALRVQNTPLASTPARGM